MSTQIPGKMFLADQRGLREDAQSRCYCTFSFGDFQHEHKGPVGQLCVLNEEWLAGGGSQPVTAAAAHVLLLPITGSLAVQTEAASTTVAVEEAMVATVPVGSTVHFTNPYPTETISFLHLQLAAETAPTMAANQRFGFDFAALGKGLVEIIAAESSGLPFSLSLGRFAGRQEARYTVKQLGSQFYAFVLAGAFELEGRLLHEKDGLALWNVSEVEIEALSNNALLLVMELP